MLWVIPLGLGAAYLLFGKKKEEEPSSEEEAAPMQTQAPMRQTLTAEQARAMGFAVGPKVPYMVQAAKRARVQDKMTMRARVGPAEPPAVKAAREAAEAAQKLGTPFGWKPGTGSATPSNPADGIAAFDASASFDLTTKLK
jgi:hypothetical protein